MVFSFLGQASLALAINRVSCVPVMAILLVCVWENAFP